MQNLVLIGGLPGSGKTTIGKQLAQRIGAAFLDKDTLCNDYTEAMLKISGHDTDDRDGAFYANHIRALEYDTLLEVAFENLSIGRSVVCVAPFTREFHNPDWEKHMREHQNVWLVWTVAQENVLRERIQKRNTPRDSWKLAHWQEWYNNKAVVIPEPIMRNSFLIHTDQDVAQDELNHLIKTMYPAGITA